MTIFSAPGRPAAMALGAWLAAGAGAALAQPSPILGDRGRLETATPPETPRSAPVPQSAPIAPTAGGMTITPREVAVAGPDRIGAEATAEARAALIGREIGQADILRVAEAIRAAYAAAGYALITVTLDAFDPASGLLRYGVKLGFVDEVRIEGDTDGANVDRLRNYAARIVVDRPLRQSTLERYILLSNDLAGRRVGSRFEPLPGRIDAVRLVLSLERAPPQIGLSINNLGGGALDRVQAGVSFTSTSLLTEGDRARIAYGFPPDFRRYSYLTGSYTLPIGYDGLTLTGSIGHLITRPTRTNALEGTATVASLQLAYPWIRSQAHNLNFALSLDVFESDQALLGQLNSSEGTRVLRAAAIYAHTPTDGSSSSVLRGVASQGLDVLGARQDIAFAYGDPNFTKFSFLAAHNRSFFDNALVLRMRMLGQIASDRLPASELFTYGGADLGRAFDPGTLAGDAGIGGAVQLAVPLAFMTALPLVTYSEIYAFIDGAQVWRRYAGFRDFRDRAASAGGGVGFRIGELGNLNLELARQVMEPRYTPTSGGWRFVMSFTRSF
ncbi:ShlB/FhaC/HecB family hemolysin secretion/activation protein [Roseomonas hellenica]|uniref:ShlB/FhaC/HecB family hemolysin secretion/activation protein n=1 Tax=Plastoroseomonas hellenica TaxID=2687306 RepID=A0ABS5F6P4_9PROT|nr:ShlB/FhaC/HecB family hemolysin secretion/activation protein [Plastoroseomonas hellenica]MBR0668171.1 ShlB/FhaC/HecB family hemolysin secretion/activation protein [Plastoroseomonas hellenica]